MSKLTSEEAVEGDKEALEKIAPGIQEMVFNLSLRMLGTFPDAEDAAQDILVKIITNLATFRGESSFYTWVFSIASNYLKNYKKHMFAKMPLSFEFYGEDIKSANVRDVSDMTQNVEKSVLAEELKLSCTNVMLQCLDSESRCIFILGTMFRLDSRIAGEILGITPEAYRQRLSRVRKKVADFLSEYCGEYGKGTCHCGDRVNYAISNHRITPARLDFSSAVISQQSRIDVKEANSQFEELIQSLILNIGEFDDSVLHNQPKDLTFKLVRDTRFSHDKSPYNPAFRAHISSMGKLPVPVGYYLMIKPGNQSFLGGGLFADMFKEATSMVRDYIVKNGDEWEEILHAPEFQEYFTVQGTALKKVPAGYDKEHPQAEFLKFKSWYLEYPLRDEKLADGEAFLKKATDIFRRMKPFNDYLNRALAGFEMPKR